MRITDAVFGALVPLLLLAHGARADEIGPYSACDDDGSCRHFKTETELKQYLEAYKEERMNTRRKTLHQLPVDERDCGIPVLIDLMESSGALREKGARLYVTMGDGDIDLLRRQALAHQGIHVLPGSSRERDSGATKLLNSTHHTKYWGFSIMVMSVGSMPDTFEFGAGYHCGSLCLGRLHYTVKVIGNSCSILSKQLLGVS
jgi:hypothetical protein